MTWPQPSIVSFVFPLRYYLKLGHGTFLLPYFQLIVHLQTVHSVLSVMECAAADIVKNKT